MKSIGINQFSHYIGSKWRLYSALRTLKESGKNIISLNSSRLICFQDISIPEKELTPWLFREIEYVNTLSTWDKDFWMTQEIANLYSNKSRKPLMKVYDTLISRNERQFYMDFCPIRWSWNIDDKYLWTNLTHALDSFKPEGNSQTVSVGNFAISIEKIRPYVLEQAKKYKVEIEHSESKRIILWARYSMLRQCNSGLDLIRIYRMMGTNVLKYGLPFINK